MYVFLPWILEQRLKNMLSTQKQGKILLKDIAKNLKTVLIKYKSSKNTILQIRYKIRKQRYKKENKNALGASIHYETTPNNSMYKNIEYRKDDCVNSSLVADTVLSLPIHAYLKEEEIAKIIKIVKESF